MSNKLGPAPLTVSATSTKVVDFYFGHNVKSAYTVLIISSDVTVILTLKDGIGGRDEANETEGDVPYVVDGSSVPVYDGTGATYTVTGGTNKEIILTRPQMAEWLRASFNNATGGAATVTIYARL